MLVGLLWPQRLFRNLSYSTVVESAEGELLGARIADDGQWRFPPAAQVPERFATALVQFEDRRFYRHPGVDPLAIGRAALQNLRQGHNVSGGSTLSMQLIRMSRGKERNLWQKLIEAGEAFRLECRRSKRDILALYAAHAPFGGNVVGLEAAAWRYFGCPAEQLSWGESALLAVLPNAPSSLHPGKGREELLAKRNRLLKRLEEHGDIDPLTCQAAMDEALPEAPLPLPQWASHYVEHCPHGERSRTAISLPLQKAVEAVCDRASDRLALEGIADLSCVVIDNAKGNTVAYVGNASAGRAREGVKVDIAASPRSTGSILKPFLYGAALEEGVILPRTLLPDVPINLGGFAPQNFDRQYYGAVPADEALARSLNVPAVFLLRQYGVPKFHALLQEKGLSTISRSPSHYGLSLILGGAEGRLDEITRAYAALPDGSLSSNYTLRALESVNRPDQLDWRLIRSLKRAAWKTGTSYGFRDAWAVGITPAYTIGVWAGNADGHAVPGLTGATAAGPVMFEILNLLPEAQWEESAEPNQGMQWASLCKDSGFLASPDCKETEMVQIPEAGLQTEPCPYHKSGEFVLPPVMEWYYRPYHPEYKGASKAVSDRVMGFIYPQSGCVISLPRQLSGQIEGAVFRLAHSKRETKVWWHLDGEYVGETQHLHELRLAPPPGGHRLSVVDEEGNSATVSFTSR